MASYSDSCGENLILEVQKYPQLYDRSLEAYKDTLQKQDIWEAVGGRVNMSGPQAAKRWKDIRDAFLKSRKKQDTKNVKPYKYEHVLGFLLPYLKTRSNMAMNDDSFADCDSDGHCDRGSEGELVETQLNNSNKPPIPVPVYLIARKRKRDESLQLGDGILNCCKEVQNGTVEDEDDAFFRSMAAMCKKLPPSVKSRVKFQIHKFLFEAEMEHSGENS
ncbi:transcription factor Adf-1-like [Acanthaster planci]|uniref:Transcription factor Adf-1-like n=1 Tax=Acanthaster planci TaxID=133434 RepID=A0A8B7Y1K0_ACAPL|nr:transcription factor Adf-1-like [Acanthaster planci]